MSEALKRIVKKQILDYKKLFRNENITNYAASGVGRNKKTLTRLQMRRALTQINARIDEVFVTLNPKVRAMTLELLGGDTKSMRRFAKTDRFNLTFTQKFQMSKKRIRKLIAKRVTELYTASGGKATSRELLAEAQDTWASTAEFSKFLAYLAADAYNFAKLETIIDGSTTGLFEIFLSDNHEKADICNAFAGFYSIDDGVDLPPYHPYCVCSVRDVKDLSARATKKTTKNRPINILDEAEINREALLVLEKEYEDYYPTITFDFSGTDSYLMVDAMAQFDVMAEKFPLVADRIRYIGTYQNTSKVPLRYTYKLHNPFPVDEIAHASVDGSRIGFNPKYYNDAQFFIDEHVRSLSSNWSVSSPDALTAATTSHEFGHQLDHYARSLDVGIPIADYTMESGVGEYWHIRALHEALYHHADEKRLSRYATYSREESRAESVSAAMHREDDKRDEFDKAVEKFLFSSAEWDNSWLEREDYEYYEDASDKAEARRSIQNTYADFGVTIHIDEDENVYAERNGLYYSTSEAGELLTIIYHRTYGFAHSLTEAEKKKLSLLFNIQGLTL